MYNMKNKNNTKKSSSSWWSSPLSPSSSSERDRSTCNKNLYRSRASPFLVSKTLFPLSLLLLSIACVSSGAKQGDQSSCKLYPTRDCCSNVKLVPKVSHCTDHVIEIRWQLKVVSTKQRTQPRSFSTPHFQPRTKDRDGVDGWGKES